MFGFSSFAQTTFAGLVTSSGSNTFLLSLLENIGASDLSTQQATFIQAITEDTSIAELHLISSVFFFDLLEAVTADDLKTAVAQFIQALTENIGLLEIMVARGWIKIDDNQTPVWVNINDTQINAWTAVSNNQTPVWVSINDTQISTWTDVNESQPNTWSNIDDSQE